MTIDALILAAGRSSRFGGEQKLLANVDGSPLVRHVALALAHSGVRDIVVVTAADTSHDVSAALGDGRWRIVVNANAADGMASSLIAGLQALRAPPSGALVALGDMPHVSAALVDELAAAFALCRGQAIVFPRGGDGQQGHPVIWPRALFDELLALTGDVGAKAVLNAHPELWHPVTVSGNAAFADIDTREDLARLLNSSD